MAGIFKGASSFDQSLSTWHVAPDAQTQGAFCGLSRKKMRQKAWPEVKREAFFCSQVMRRDVTLPPASI